MGTTIGNWLEDKKAELGYYELPEIKEFWTIKRLSSNAKKHLEFWKKYRDVVKNMKIIDQACGFRVIIMTHANSQVNTRILELLPKFKIKKMNRWCFVL